MKDIPLPDSFLAAGAGASPLAVWRLEHPLWLCAFRPFFVLLIVAALMGMLSWVAFLALGWPLPTVPGGPFVWHVHEMLLGVGLAAVAGFALTAVPEFTATPSFAARSVRRLVAAWLLGRVAFWGSGVWAPLWLLAGLAHMGLLLGVLALLWPRLWAAAERRHMSFAWALLGLLVTAAGFYVQGWRGAATMPWLHAMLGVLMILIVVAMSRISMRIVNTSLEECDSRDDEGERRLYLARPPRRNLAMLCLGLHAVAVLSGLPASTTGWLALAAAAAVLNLMGDWHVGRALLRRWPLLLYAVYVFMALGYGLSGWAGLTSALPVNAGVHLLTAGALSLGVMVVVVIAGHTHSGLEKGGRDWVLWAMAGLMLAALLRAAAYGAAPQVLQALSGLLWAAAFALLAWHMLPVLLTPRRDGAEGCAGVIGEG